MTFVTQIIAHAMYMQHFVQFILKTFFMFISFSFELMINVLVNSHGHVGVLPPFYGTYTQNDNVMTSNKCFKYNLPN